MREDLGLSESEITLRTGGIAGPPAAPAPRGSSGSSASNSVVAGPGGAAGRARHRGGGDAGGKSQVGVGCCVGRVVCNRFAV